MHTLEKSKSSSLHNLLLSDSTLSEPPQSVKSKSQEDLLAAVSSDVTTPASDAVTQPKQTLIMVRSLESSTDDDVTPRHALHVSSKSKSKSSFALSRARDVSASSDLGQGQQRSPFKRDLRRGRGVTLERDDSVSSTASSGSGSRSSAAGGGVRLASAQSESFLAAISGDATPKLPVAVQQYRGSYMTSHFLSCKCNYPCVISCRDVAHGPLVRRVLLCRNGEPTSERRERFC